MSGWQDSNLRPPGPKPGAMTGLRYTPNDKNKHKQDKKRNNIRSFYVTPKRFERLTYCLEGSCSIQLSYGVIIFQSKTYNKALN
jgi:hypothetical protein